MATENFASVDCMHYMQQTWQQIIVTSGGIYLVHSCHNYWKYILHLFTICRNSSWCTYNRSNAYSVMQSDHSSQTHETMIIDP